MPEHLAPGVFVEETSFQSRPIQGIDTTTAAFVGPTRKGPWGWRPRLLTSLVDFQRIYGGFAELRVSGPPELRRNHVAHAAYPVRIINHVVRQHDGEIALADHRLGAQYGVSEPERLGLPHHGDRHAVRQRGTHRIQQCRLV